MLGTVAVTAFLCVREGSPAMAAIVVGACALTWVLCPAVAAFAMRVGACVRPGGRADHATCIPRLGGVAIYAPVAYTLLRAGGPHAAALLAGATVVFLAGVWDDVRGLTPRRKIAAQVAAALVLIAGGYRITGLRIDPLGTLPMQGFESAALVAWIVFTANAINLIDGLDGLAATIALVAAIGHAALGAPLPVSLALAGACLGFLRHNLPRARLFLGDSGSMLLGFLLGALPLGSPGPLNVPVAIGLLALPFGDVALCIARRWLRAKPLSAPDRGHLHHVLLRLWGQSSPLVLLGLGSVAAAQAVAICLRPDVFGLLAAGLFLAATVVYVVSRARPDWPRILLHRRGFRRIHLARNYALGALRIAGSRDEVRDAVQRVVDDFGLAAAEVGGLRVERTKLPALTGPFVGEEVQCDEGTARWNGGAENTDHALLEEKRIVVCEVLREASRRLRCFATAAAPRNGHARAGIPEAPGHAAAVHCVVEDLTQLERVASLVPAMRDAAKPRAVVVFPGRDDDLLRGLPPGEDGLTVPVICLGVAPEDDPRVLAQRVGARYHDLLARERPAATVVVGEGGAASGCAMAAGACGIDVVQFDAPAGSARRRRIRAHARNGGMNLVRAIRLIPAPRLGPPAPPISATGNAMPGEEAPCPG